MNKEKFAHSDFDQYDELSNKQEDYGTDSEVSTRELLLGCGVVLSIMACLWLAFYFNAA